MTAGPVTQFIDRHFLHFNAAALKDAADAYRQHVEEGGSMLVTLAGAMSTAELGKSLAEMIRQGKVHGICCTGANLEEDVFNLVAHDHYVRIPHYRDLTPQDEQALLDRHLNRVTDTCIPEGEAMRRIEAAVLDLWQTHDAAGTRQFPHEFLYELLRSGRLAASYQIDPADSWLMAAAETQPADVRARLGGRHARQHVCRALHRGTRHERAHRADRHRVHDGARASGITDVSPTSSIGFFQIGGGIAGDFPICVVPMLHQDLQRTDVPLWGYFCQISDSTTSYGVVFGSGAEREDHLGQARRRHAEVHRRVGRHDRGAADVRPHPRLVGIPA